MHFFSKKCKNSSEPTRNLIVSNPMFWSTGNHWGLQEDTHYCPNVTCWCVNCQHICMQKLYQFPVCFIYEESLQIDMSTGPNAVDVSTVSLMHLWTVPSLLHIWREHTDRPVNLSQCWWYVNCQHICQQKMRLWTVPSLLHRVCMQKDMSTCPNAVVVSTVSIFVSMSQEFSGTIPWQTIVNHSMPYLTMANHNKSFHDHEFGAPRCKTYNPLWNPKAHNPKP